MKKVMLALTAVALVGVAQADLVSREWTSQNIYAQPNLGLADYEGAAWQIDIALAGTVADRTTPSLVSAAVPGTADTAFWYDGYGLLVGGFNFTADEGQEVVMRIFNAPTQAEATMFLDSVAMVLADVEGAPPPGAFDVTFDHGTYAAPAGQWQAVVPEPATFGLMGIAGLGLFLARRKTQR